MKKGILRKASMAGALAAGGALLLGSGAAYADGPDMTSAGNNGIGNGTQLMVPVQAPIDVCGNGVAVLGAAGAGCQGGSDASLEESAAVDEEDGALGDQTSAGNAGILNGTQAEVPVQAPIDVCGNSVGALVGIAGAGCQGGSDASLDSDEGNSNEAGAAEATAPADDDSTLGDMTSAGNNGILNGTQVQAPIQVPVDVCGNAVAVLGVSGAGCQGGSDASLGDDADDADNDAAAQQQQPQQQQPGGGFGQPGGSSFQAPQQGGDTEAAAPADDDSTLGDMTSAGNNGILNGTQAQVPVQVPVDVSGNAVGVAGVAGAGSQGGSGADLG